MTLTHGQVQIEQPSRADTIRELQSMQNLDTLVLEKSPAEFLQVLYTQNSYLIEYRQSAKSSLMKLRSHVSLTQTTEIFTNFMQETESKPPQAPAGLEWASAPSRVNGLIPALTSYFTRVVIRADLRPDDTMLQGGLTPPLRIIDYTKASLLGRAWFLVVQTMAVMILLGTSIVLSYVLVKQSETLSAIWLTVVVIIDVWAFIAFLTVQPALRWMVRHLFSK